MFTKREELQRQRQLEKKDEYKDEVKHENETREY